MKNVILIFYLAQADILEQINKNVIQPVSKVQSDSRNMQRIINRDTVSFLLRISCIKIWKF